MAKQIPLCLASSVLRLSVSSVLLLTVLLAAPLRAQVPDTLQTDTTRVDTTQAVAPDSLRAPAAQEVPFVPLPFLTAPRGTPVVDSLPVRYPTPDLEYLLTRAPGSFLYDLGANGWPHGWSWEGFAPDRPALLFDGHPYNDPVTGRPRFDLLPPAFLRAPRVGTDRLGGPVAVYAEPRFYDVDRPFTELRYRRDNTAMQSVAVSHAQQRRIALLGDPGLLQIVGGYNGRAADNTYDNSDLRRERRLFGRLRYRQTRWSVTLRNLHSRRKIGAHGGVIPQGPFITVYNPLIVNVRNPQARRQTIRNDLALTVRMPLVPGLTEPVTLSANWAAQTFRYYNPDTLLVKTNSYHAYLRQDVTLGPQTLFAELGGTLDRVRTTNAWAGDRSRIRLHATLRDSVALGATTLVLDGGLHADTRSVRPAATAHVAQRWGATRLFAEAGLAPQTTSWIAENGFGGFVQPLDAAPEGRILQGRLGVQTRFGAFDARLAGFAHTIEDPVELYATGAPDTLAARVSPQPFRRAGVTLGAGWRRNARAGLYAAGQATATAFLNPDAAPENARVDEVLPRLYGQGRVGVRFVAFAGDLDADLYVKGRAWTRTRSRQFHPPTGLFAIPPPDAPVLDNPAVPLRFGPYGTLDATFEAGIRGATLFFTFENLLSGTRLQPGVLVVPVYPLPERRFRFGVFWPIWD